LPWITTGSSKWCGALVRLAKYGMPPAEQYRYQADADLVYQSQVEGLPRDVGACDGDIFFAGDFPGTRDAFGDTVDEGSVWPLRSVLGCVVGHDGWRADRVIVPSGGAECPLGLVPDRAATRQRRLVRTGSQIRTAGITTPTPRLLPSPVNAAAHGGGEPRRRRLKRRSTSSSTGAESWTSCG
jgi:hypothetical protein